MREKILNKAGELFFLYGLKATGINEIAVAAGLNKKTVYEHFNNKQEIISSFVDLFLNKVDEELRQACKIASDPIELVIKSAPVFFQNIAGSSNVFFHDLQRLYPETWLKFSNYRKEILHPAIIRNLTQGVESGLFEPGLDVAFTADLRMHQILTCIDPYLFNGKEQPRGRLLLTLTIFYLKGITTPKGKSLLANYLKESAPLSNQPIKQVSLKLA